MSKQTAASFFIRPPSEAKSAELYQALLRGIENYQQLGQRLIQLAEQAHAFRQFDRVREYGQILSNIPIKSFQTVGHYYLAVAANSMGNGDQDRAQRLFEMVVDTAPELYKAKAILSLAAVAANAKDYQTQLRYLIESAKASKDVSTTARAHLGIAIYKGIEGFHKQSLSDLENLYTLARYSQPVVFFDYLNSLAVELGEVGRKDEARNIMRVVLASPFARVYPEWRETAEDLKPSRRSFVAVGSSRFNVLAMPEREPSKRRTLEPTPARVLDLIKWKKQMTKKELNDKPKKRGKKAGNPDNPEPLSLAEMTSNDMTFRLLELITENFNNEDYLRQIIEYAEKLLAEPSQPDPDKPAS